MTNLRRLVGSKGCIYSRNKTCLRVEGVRTCSLVLKSGFNLILEKIFYIPTFSRNLNSVSSLVPFGYSFQFSDKSLFIYYKSNIIGNSNLSDGLLLLICKIMPLITPCMFKWALNDVLLMTILLLYGIGDYVISL